jgi:hypothetical protein
VAGLGVAERSTPRDGVLVAALLTVAGAGLVGAVVLESERVATTLLGMWAGTVIGVVVAAAVSGLVGQVAGPASAALVFWMLWVGAIMATTARGFMRGVSR